MRLHKLCLASGLPCPPGQCVERGEINHFTGESECVCVCQLRARTLASTLLFLPPLPVSAKTHVFSLLLHFLLPAGRRTELGLYRRASCALGPPSFANLPRLRPLPPSTTSPRRRHKSFIALRSSDGSPLAFFAWLPTPSLRLPSTPDHFSAFVPPSCLRLSIHVPARIIY